MVEKISSNNFAAAKKNMAGPKPLNTYSDCSLFSLKVLSNFYIKYIKN